MDDLSRQEVINVIEGKGAARRPPVLYDLWIVKQQNPAFP